MPPRECGAFLLLIREPCGSRCPPAPTRRSASKSADLHVRIVVKVGARLAYSGTDMCPDDVSLVLRGLNVPAFLIPSGQFSGATLGYPRAGASSTFRRRLMRAMTYRGPYKVRVEEKANPAIEHPNDAIVRVQLAAICGSDLHLYHGLMPDTRVGHTFGHEFIGVVEEVGSSVETMKRGDRVMVPFNIYCGSCYFCARGLYSNCHNVNPNATAVGGIYGYSHTCGGYDGGQAEYVRVPFADVGPSLIPDWMDDTDALLCTEDRKR